MRLDERRYGSDPTYRELKADVLEDDLRVRWPALAALAADETTDALERLEAASRLHHEVAAAVDDILIDLRNDKERPTWAELGSVLYDRAGGTIRQGLTPQAVEQRVKRIRH